MTTCKECEFFNTVPPEADDYVAGKGDCVTETVDEKGKYWLSRPVHQRDPLCAKFSRRWQTQH
jgi:benzylsuccinate synthase